MTLTELRETLSAVSDALPVPAPDAAAFQGRLRRARRRRTAGIVAGTAAAALVVAGGATLALGPGDSPDHRRSVAHQPPAPRSAGVPVLVENHVREVSPDGVLGPELLGPVGPDIATIVGTTPHGVVVLTDAGSLARIDEADRRLEPLVGDQVVRSAYLDGDAVVYETENGLIHWRGIEPVVLPRDSARTEAGRLLGAGTDMAVVAGDQVLLHDSAGIHPLTLPPDTQVISQVDLAAGVAAIRTDRGDLLLTDHGRTTHALPGDRYAALALDGHAYARATASRDAVELFDPVTAGSTPVAGPSGRVSDLRWTEAGDLMVVVAHEGGSTLWRCAGGTDCSPQLDDDTGTLRLR